MRTNSAFSIIEIHREFKTQAIPAVVYRAVAKAPNDQAILSGFLKESISLIQDTKKRVAEKYPDLAG